MLWAFSVERARLVVQGIAFGVRRAAQGHGNSYFLLPYVRFALLLYHTALQALYLWQSRYNSSRAAGSFLCDSDGWCFCMCRCVRFCVCASRVYAAKGTKNDQELYSLLSKRSRSAGQPQNRFTASAQQQQRYNSSRASRPCLCHTSHDACVCGWWTAGDRITK